MRLSIDSEAVATPMRRRMDKELKRRLAGLQNSAPGISSGRQGLFAGVYCTHRLAPHAEKAIYDAVSLDQGRSSERADRSAARQMRLRDQAFRIHQGEQARAN